MVSQQPRILGHGLGRLGTDRHRSPVEHHAGRRADRHHPPEHVLTGRDGRSEVEQLQHLPRGQVPRTHRPRPLRVDVVDPTGAHGRIGPADDLVGAVEQLGRGVVVEEPPQGAEVVDVGLPDHPVELVDPRDDLLGVAAPDALEGDVVRIDQRDQELKGSVGPGRVTAGPHAPASLDGDPAVDHPAGRGRAEVGQLLQPVTVGGPPEERHRAMEAQRGGRIAAQLGVGTLAHGAIVGRRQLARDRPVGPVRGALAFRGGPAT